MPEQACVICENDIHSITTRRVGDHALCVDCGNKVAPLVAAIVNSLVARIAEVYRDSNLEAGVRVTVSDIARVELRDNFAPLVSNPSQVRQLIG